VKGDDTQRDRCSICSSRFGHVEGVAVTTRPISYGGIKGPDQESRLVDDRKFRYVLMIGYVSISHVYIDEFWAD
jgi:hypothetical protein